MICQICITSNKADHLITYKGDSLVVCDTCFENRPAGAHAVPEQPEPEEDPMRDYMDDAEPPTMGDWILSTLPNPGHI